MKANLRVQVKACDIRKGVRGDCGVCPVALALLRKFRSCEKVSVGASIANVYYEGLPDRDRRFLLPKRVNTFINRFDMSQDTTEDRARFKPFEFRLTEETA